MSSIEERFKGRDLAIDSLLKNSGEDFFISCGEDAIKQLKQQQKSARKSSRQSASYRSVSATRLPIVKFSVNKPLIGGILGGVFAVAAAIMFITIIQPFMNSLPGKPIIKEVVNEVFILRKKEKIIVKVGDQLQAGDELIVSQNSQALVSYDDLSLVLVHEDSIVNFYNRENSKMTRMIKGNFFFKIYPQNKSNPFVITTANCEVEVVGTSFDLSHRTSKTTLKMKTGIVRVKDLINNEIKLVERGQSLEIDASKRNNINDKKNNTWLPDGRVNSDTSSLFHFSKTNKNKLLNFKLDNSNLIGHKLIKGYSLSKKSIRFAAGSFFINDIVGKEIEAIANTGELTLEFWLKGNLKKDQSGLLFSLGEKTNNVVSSQNWQFVIEQEENSFQIYLRSGKNEMTLKDLIIDDATENTANHFVVTVNAEGTISVYINGQEIIKKDSIVNLHSWANLKNVFYQLGGAISGGHQWEGDIYLIALYHKALVKSEVKTNFEFGYK
ncbi:MAG: hypothetical protein COA79_05230 [Planctomycetota bacterium]|nr:MAG: hypothetical protein COA79_05230 [Planctomycetota bacterium]